MTNDKIFITSITDNPLDIAIKDNIVTKDILTTAGSKVLENWIPNYNATVIERLLSAGYKINGKTNCDEFGMGSSGENSAYGITKNPWDTTKVPGGSSSGSAVAVALGLCSFALGTDTGGSIRQPASLCGVVGLRPSYGKVSRYGLIAMASSMDTIGPLTKTVRNARKILSIISGEDTLDIQTLNKIIPQSKNSNFTVGIPSEYFNEDLDAGVKEVIFNAIETLKTLGVKFVEVSLPSTPNALGAYYTIMMAEVSSNMARYNGIRFGKPADFFGAEVKRRIEEGKKILSEGYYDNLYGGANKIRQQVKDDFNKVFEQCDAIVGPVSPTVAWDIGAKQDPKQMYLSDVYTVPASLAGLPAISIPCGFSENLPVGLQIIGKYFDEETILNLAESFESNTDFHTKQP